MTVTIDSWALIATLAIISAYKLTALWLDSREPGVRETDTYSSIEAAPHEPREDIPDVRLGFQREQR